jgi:cytosine/adenosine deaminase-related metal-dependent hydrolase
MTTAASHGSTRAMRAAIAAALASALAIGHTPAARAEGCPDDSVEQGEKKQGKFHIEYINGKPVTVIDTIVSVCGKVPRPSVVYVLTAKNIDYEWESLKQDFLPLILASVKKAPF